MKILHTADWHLGQKFLNQERTEEQSAVLNQILAVVHAEQINLLLVAGDIFDQRNPSIAARQLFFKFLHDVSQGPCDHVVIVGGNHDSAGMLNTAREFLNYHNIHVIGGATDSISDELIELKNGEGKLEAVVAAVPFLHDRDLRKGVIGENSQERVQRIQEGLVKHYQELAELCKSYKDVPILATGHLFAKGASGSEEQANIYLGDRENIGAEHFPKIFDYIALGHLHRAQKVGSADHVRYSGAPMPLSFKEYDYQHGCWILHFEKTELKQIDFHELNAPRKLLRYEGTLEQVKKQLVDKGEKLLEEQTSFPAWVDVLVDLEKFVPNLSQEVNNWVADYPMEIVMCRIKGLRDQQAEAEDHTLLEHLQPLDIFRKKCEAEKYDEKSTKELEATFLELCDLMKIEEAEA